MIWFTELKLSAPFIWCLVQNQAAALASSTLQFGHKIPTYSLDKALGRLPNTMELIELEGRFSQPKYLVLDANPIITNWSGALGLLARITQVVKIDYLHINQTSLETILASCKWSIRKVRSHQSSKWRSESLQYEKENGSVSIVKLPTNKYLLMTHCAWPWRTSRKC